MGPEDDIEDWRLRNHQWRQTLVMFMVLLMTIALVGVIVDPMIMFFAILFLFIGGLFVMGYVVRSSTTVAVLALVMMLIVPCTLFVGMIFMHGTYPYEDHGYESTPTAAVTVSFSDGNYSVEVSDIDSPTSFHLVEYYLLSERFRVLEHGGLDDLPPELNSTTNVSLHRGDTNDSWDHSRLSTGDVVLLRSSDNDGPAHAGCYLRLVYERNGRTIVQVELS